MSSLLKRSALAVATLGSAALFMAPAHAIKCETGGGIGCKSDDGQFKTEFGGRFQVDANIFEDDTEADEGDGLEFRRLRLFNKFTLYGRYFGKVQIDFAGDAVDIEDAYVGIKDLGPGDLVVGQTKIPFSLNELTSSKYITFIERSFYTDYITGTRQLGVDYNLGGSNWTIATAAYSPEDTGDTFDGPANNPGAPGRDGIGVGIRGTIAPVLRDDLIVHLGAAANQENNRVLGTDDIDISPEAHLGGDFPLLEAGGAGTDNVPADGFEVFRWGVEGAVVAGPFSAQAEYGTTTFEEDNSGFDQDVTGGYVFVSYFLTPGDSRNYEADAGKFGRTKPSNGFGAWEVAARYSTVENTDTPSGSDREANGVTLALNYYPTKNVRFMLNYIQPDFTVGNTDVFDDDIFLARFQADWGD